MGEQDGSTVSKAKDTVDRLIIREILAYAALNGDKCNGVLGGPRHMRQHLNEFCDRGRLGHRIYGPAL